MAMERRSKFICRKNIEDAPPSSFSINDIKLGDQVLFKIPFAPGDSTRQCWGYVFRKFKSGSLRVVVDSPWISNSVANIKNKQEYTVNVSSVIGVIEEFDFGQRCSLEISVLGVINDIRISDGSTKPVTVKVDDGDSVTYFSVGHRGAEEIMDR